VSQPRTPPDQLIFTHQGLVRSLARSIHRGFPSYVDLDDLVGYGQVGLAQAARDFDPERGLQFSTFAYHRIRGAILDGAHQLMWQRRATRPPDAYERMSSDVMALDSADADSPGASSDDAPWLGEVGGKLTVVFLLSQFGEEGRERLEPNDDSAAPLERLLDDELKQMLREQLEKLPDDCRRLLHYAYFDGLTLKEAGERIGISKAWASRLHARSLEQLARSLKQSQVAD
jgi:RNA polymerase sigma factor for flagellar operon FliA